MFSRKHLAILAAAAVFLASCGAVKSFTSKRYYDEGKQLFAQKKYKEARTAFRKAIQKDPKSGEAYYQLALLKLEQGGDVTEALWALQQAMPLLPENEDVKVKLAHLWVLGYLQQGSIEKLPLQQAKDISKSLLQRNPKSLEGLRLSGHIALMEKKADVALGFFEQALAIKGDSAETLGGQGEALVRLGRQKEAEAALLKALRLKKDYSSLYDLLYRMRMSQKEYSGAEEILRQRIAAMPENATAVATLAAHFARMQKPKEAEAALAPLLEDTKHYPAGALYAGDFHRSLGELEKARQLYQQGLKSPAVGANAEMGAEYRKRLASLLLLEGKREDAEKAYSAVLQDAPKDPESRSRRALLTMDKDAAAALKEFQGLVKENQANPMMRFYLGQAYLANRQTENARTSFLEASRMQRNFLEPRLALAQIALDENRYKEVVQYANEVLGANPRHPDARYYHSAGNTGLGNYFEARKEVTELLKEFPTFREAQLQLAFIELSEKKYANAEGQLRELYKSSKDVRALTGITEVYFAQGKSKEALQFAQGELKASQEDPRIRLLVARTAMRAADYPEAVKQFLRLAERDTNWDYLYMQLGTAHQLNGDLPRAVLAYQKAVQISPDNVEAILRLAYGYESAGRYKEAIEAYRQGIKLNPNTPVAMNNLAYLLCEHGGDLDEALKFAQMALQRIPQQKYIADTVGWIFYRKNELDSANQIFAGLVKKYPEEAAFHYHLGAGLLKKGDRMRAKSELKAALEARPPEDMEKKIRALLSEIG